MCLMLVPLMAAAAGLGRLTVISGLGEPLNAEIELISTTPEELASLTASIAPAEAYSAQGLERPAISSAIKIDVDSRPGAKSVLKLSTRQAVTDPFLDMLVQVDWSTGRLLREYTILLDPPGYATPSVPGAANAPAITTQAPPATTPSGAASQDPFAEAPPAATGAVQTHETARGDTLNAIAREMQVEGVSLEQMLVGLYRANKQAFAGDNMNRLRVGQVIRAPAPEELQAIGQREAAREIRVQTADWNAYRNQLAGIVADAEAGAGDESGQSASGKLSGPAEDRATPPSDAEQDVVKLSKSDSSATDKPLQDKLNALQEEVTARENSLKEANERTAALEKQIQDMQELLAIKNQTLANLQQKPAGPNAASPAAADKAAQQPTKPVAAAKPAATPSSPAACLLDDVLQNPLLLPIALAVLAVLVIIWLLLRNKRRRELDSFEKGILTAGGLKANTVFGNTSGNTIDTGDTSFLTDFSQSTGGMIDTHDVDPIAEAEVYMAYGRDAQAEEILKDAIAKEPKRYELHLKLLEIFAARNDAASFETVAGELYSTLGAADPIWSKVAETGHRLEPENPLYAIAATGVEPAPVEPENDQLAGELGAAEQASATDLDFSLGSNAVAENNAAGLFDDSRTTSQEPQVEPTEVLPTLDLSQLESSDNDKRADEDANAMDFFASPIDEPQPDKLDAASAAGTAPAVENALPAFDIPELTPEVPDNVNQIETPPQLQGISLDFPPIEGQGAARDIEASSDMPSLEQQTPPLEFVGFEESNLPADDAFTSEEKIVFEAMPGHAADDELDSENGEDDNLAPPVSINNMPEMDLSSISLDLDDDDKAGDRDALSSESAEVNTKLDLVGAYLDMDDVEGARELLEEVLKEGGPGQRQHAQKLLEGLA